MLVLLLISCCLVPSCSPKGRRQGAKGEQEMKEQEHSEEQVVFPNDSILLHFQGPVGQVHRSELGLEGGVEGRGGGVCEQLVLKIHV